MKNKETDKNLKEDKNPKKKVTVISPVGNIEERLKIGRKENKKKYNEPDYIKNIITTVNQKKRSIKNQIRKGQNSKNKFNVFKRI